MFQFFGGLALMALGITMLVNPRLFYELTESWKHTGSAEPSDGWMFSTRFGGVMCTLAGALGVVVTFMS